MNEETLERLMVKAADGEATPKEYEALMAYLVEHPELERELDMHRELNAITEGWVARLEQDLRDDEGRRRGLLGLWSGLGITLILGGMAVMLGGGMVELMIDPEAPLWLRLGVGSLIGGTVMLLGGAVVRRLWHDDPYAGVIR